MKIVTTARHVDAINRLADYWSSKSIFLKMKNAPNELGNDPMAQKKLLDYFARYTRLEDYHFWQTLSQEDRAKSLKYFRISEMKQKCIRILPNAENAEVCVMLQGSADISSSTMGVSTTQEGGVFGSIAAFDQVTDVHRGRIKRDPEPSFEHLLPQLDGGMETLMGTL